MVKRLNIATCSNDDRLLLWLDRVKREENLNREIQLLNEQENRNQQE